MKPSREPWRADERDEHCLGADPLARDAAGTVGDAKDGGAESARESSCWPVAGHQRSALDSGLRGGHTIILEFRSLEGKIERLMKMMKRMGGMKGLKGMLACPSE
jgi:hypothetical protein